MVSSLMMILGFQGVPPSRLGFVCKPDMPPHINILFRARPPLSWAPLPYKGKCREYSGMLEETPNILDKFEKTNPPERIRIDDKRSLRMKNLVESIEKNKASNYEKLAQCKYNIRYLSVRRYLSIYYFFIFSP